jgi:NAD+ kinase
MRLQVTFTPGPRPMSPPRRDSSPAIPLRAASQPGAADSSELARAGEPVVKFALNDAVLHQGAMARLIEVNAFCDGQLIAAYRADGLIIATPTGSTAYNMAAGGPIVVPGQAAMTLTPICAHALTNRPLVINADATIRLELGADARGVILTVDGQWAHSFLPGDVVEMTAAKRPLVMFVSQKSFFDVMRDKLHWGVRLDKGAK